MGMIERVLTLMFGNGANVVRDTAQVFRENADAQGRRATLVQSQALQQYGQEFWVPRQGRFDRFMDGLNRLPRPALALGTLGLFVSAMVAPLWFAERMQGIALVPEPLWWLLGVIVSFYFGARHQVKAQKFQREVVASMRHVPDVMHNMQQLREMRFDQPGVADSKSDRELTASALLPEANAALDAWRKVAGQT